MGGTAGGERGRAGRGAGFKEAPGLGDSPVAAEAAGVCASRDLDPLLRPRGSWPEAGLLPGRGVDLRSALTLSPPPGPGKVPGGMTAGKSFTAVRAVPSSDPRGAPTGGARGPEQAGGGEPSTPGATRAPPRLRLAPAGSAVPGRGALSRSCFSNAHRKGVFPKHTTNAENKQANREAARGQTKLVPPPGGQGPAQRQGLGRFLRKPQEGKEKEA